MSKKKKKNVKEDVTMENENIVNEEIQTIVEPIIEKSEVVEEPIIEATAGLAQVIDEVAPVEEDVNTTEITIEDTPVEENNEEIQNNSEPVEGVKEIFGTVTASHLNVRTEPNKESEVATIIDKNTIVKILDDLGDFYRISILDKTEGFCVKEFITINK